MTKQELLHFAEPESEKGGNMYSNVLSAAISGVEGVAVLVEADVSNGLPMFSMVGFLSSRVR